VTGKERGLDVIEYKLSGLVIGAGAARRDRYEQHHETGNSSGYSQEFA
jgi:hypothetical protein